jgi:hypothetical protein
MLILNMISFTSILVQTLVAILYSLGFIFYKFNQSVSTNIHQELDGLKTEESIEYFSPAGDDDTKQIDSSFENYDDYSAFSRDKALAVETDSSLKKTDVIESSNDDYVSQNTTPTARVDEDFEVISFNLQVEQENSIVMSSQEDIRRVFLNQAANDSVTRGSKIHN